MQRHSDSQDTSLIVRKGRVDRTQMETWRHASNGEDDTRQRRSRTIPNEDGSTQPGYVNLVEHASKSQPEQPPAELHECFIAPH